MISILYQLLFLTVVFYGIKKSTCSDVLSRDNTDTIRYACCIMVMFSHIMYSGTYFILGYPHFVYVTIFFLFSGYGLTLSFLKDRTVFLKKHMGRIIKLLIPLVIVVLLEKSFHYSLGKAGLWWFLVLILFYFYIGIIAFLFSNKYAFVTLNILFVITYSFFFQEIVSTKEINLGWTSYLGWAQQSVGFALGIILALWKKKIFAFIKKYQVILGVLAFILLIPASLMYIKPHDITKVTNEQYFIREIISLSIILLLLILLTHFSFGNKISKFVGSNLAIYIFAIHGFFINMADELFENVNLKISFIIIGSITSSILLYYLTNVFLLVKGIILQKISKRHQS